MEAILVSDDLKSHWNSFVQTNAGDGGLLQSWEWGDFMKSLGNRIFRLGAVDDSGQFSAVALLVQHEIHFEYNYLYSPRGPVIGQIKAEDWQSFFIEMKNIAVLEKSFMIKVDPPWLIGHEDKLKAVGFKPSDWQVQPKCCLVVDLAKSEDELLAGMKQKTRYNLGLAKRKEVKVRISTEMADLEAFWELTKQTARRDKFRSHHKDHYKKMFEVFSPGGAIKLFLAEADNRIIAASMVSFFGRTATYLHGASSDQYRDSMAPYLLQWEAMAAAKNEGCRHYDFGGVNGETFYDERWQGISRFKAGFAESQAPKEYIGGYEWVINPLTYSVYKFVKQIKG